MNKKITQSLDNNTFRQGKNTKNSYTKELFNILFETTLSRRMAATKLGFTDQTYMITPFILNWIRQGKASVIGVIKCERSGRFVEAVSTNPDLFPKPNQLKLF
jgi:hypothetical protein